MIKLSAILTDDCKNKNWFSKNYFWSGTLIVVLVCLLLFLLNVKNPILYGYSSRGWSDGLYFNPLFYGFINSFRHINLQHTLLNMLCFFIVGLYLERRIGTIKLLLLVIASAFLSTGIIAANSGGVGSVGYSGVNYALYFYVIVDYIFLLCQKSGRTKSRIILGAVLLALIYWAMCFNGGTTDFGFEWYPHDLLHNQGHTGGAFAGSVIGLIVQITKISMNRERTGQDKSTGNVA